MCRSGTRQERVSVRTGEGPKEKRRGEGRLTTKPAVETDCEKAIEGEEKGREE